MRIIITGKEFKEERVVQKVNTRKVTVYPTNIGNLSVNEIAALDGIKSQTARNNIYRGKYQTIKRRRGRPSKS